MPACVVHTYANHASKLTSRFGLPRELIRDVSGQVAFEEEMAKLKPLRVSDQDISDASVKLVTNHTSAFADQRIVAQRHQVSIVLFSIFLFIIHSFLLTLFSCRFASSPSPR